VRDIEARPMTRSLIRALELELPNCRIYLSYRADVARVSLFTPSSFRCALDRDHPKIIGKCAHARDRAYDSSEKSTARENHLGSPLTVFQPG